MLASFAFAQKIASFPKTETFVWRYDTLTLGSLEVPTGYTAETENYLEGIVTRLSYPDGSSLVLQKGGLYRIPMFQDPEHVLDSSKPEEARTVRRGHYRGRSRCWGEIDFAPSKTDVAGKSVLSIFPPKPGIRTRSPQAGGRVF